MLSGSPSSAAPLGLEVDRDNETIDGDTFPHPNSGPIAWICAGSAAPIQVAFHVWRIRGHWPSRRLREVPGGQER
jgi:hypothetical protein